MLKQPETSSVRTNPPQSKQPAEPSPSSSPNASSEKSPPIKRPRQESPQELLKSLRPRRAPVMETEMRPARIMVPELPVHFFQRVHLQWIQMRPRRCLSPVVSRISKFLARMTPAFCRTVAEGSRPSPKAAETGPEGRVRECE